MQPFRMLGNALVLAAAMAASAVCLADGFGMGFVAPSAAHRGSLESVSAGHRLRLSKATIPILHDKGNCASRGNDLFLSLTRKTYRAKVSFQRKLRCAAESHVSTSDPIKTWTKLGLSSIAALSLCIGLNAEPVHAEGVREMTNSQSGGAVEDGYVDPVDLDQLSEKAFSAMLSSLDPFTEFENPRAADQVKSFEGYAYDAGVRVGDKILEICQTPGSCTSTKDLPLPDVRNLLKGSTGTDIKIRYQRPGILSTQEVTVKRKEVLLRDVPVATFLGDPSEGVGYVKLRGFSEMAPVEVAYVIDRLQQVSPVKAVVLDLRGNPGGLLSSAVRIANLFLPEGTEVVTTKGRALNAQRSSASIASNGFSTTYSVKKNSKLPFRVPENMRLVLLVDQGTASAAEIISGAIQDHDRGVIIGQRTYGKGLVQQVESLKGGSLLKYTAGKYYTPSGRCIQSRVYRDAGEGQLGTEEVVVKESERKVFFTDAGRPVKDAGGIEPDIFLPKSKASGHILSKKLEETGAFYRFAGIWESKHLADGEQILRSKEPIVTDEVYEQFQGWVEKNAPNMQAPFDPSLNLLIDALKETGFDAAIPKVSTLKASLQQLLTMEFQSDSEAIKRKIDSAIRDRFLPESINMAHELNDDEEVHVAFSVARDSGRYLAIIDPAGRSSDPAAGSTHLASEPDAAP